MVFMQTNGAHSKDRSSATLAAPAEGADNPAVRSATTIRTTPSRFGGCPMPTGPYTRVRKVLLVAAAGLAAMSLTACPGRGGGQLPPDNVLFKGAASFGFSFSCEDKGG